MELWLKYYAANKPDFDKKLSVASVEEWQSFTIESAVLSSVLWPGEPCFHLPYRHMKRNHPHERDYVNNTERNLSYLQGCRKLAESLNKLLSGARCLVYAPLRGAYPIWKVTAQFIKDIECSVCYPVTSSFIFFPEGSVYINKKGRPASGRYNHILELTRIRPFLDQFDYLLYVDEIVSGSMMKGHLQDMFRLGIHHQIPVIAMGLADSFGLRSTTNRHAIEKFRQKGILRYFLWEGCQSLITEDQKFLLGIHYIDYHSGPHVVPVLNAELSYFKEKMEFDNDLYGHHLD
ncbi:MAG TPA: hypothetical protein P5531_11935 [Bacteroidales bacterium]|nr:hypothetical protein [Bacteroidales bacterium]HSA44331.1 hypothetical protein [Bacteroidales bacterium]